MNCGKKLKNVEVCSGGQRSTKGWRTIKFIRQATTKDVISPISAEEWDAHFEDVRTISLPSSRTRKYLSRIDKVRNKVVITYFKNMVTKFQTSGKFHTCPGELWT